MSASPTSSIRWVWRPMADHRIELVAAATLGAAAALSAVALLGTAAWLIATAATGPPVLTLTVAAVMVRFFAISRGVLRYAERLVGHDAALRGLVGLRERVYRNLERLTPVGVRAFGRGDLLTRLVVDVDSAMDLPLRVVLPWVQAVVVGVGTVVFVAWLLPGAGVVVAVGVLLAALLVPQVTARTARHAHAASAPTRAALGDAVVRALDATGDLAAAGAGDAALARLGALDDDAVRIDARGALASGAGSALAVFAQAVAVVGSVAVAAPAVADGRLSSVWLAVAVLLPLALVDVLSTLPDSAVALQRIRSSADRLAAMERAPTPRPEPATACVAPPVFTGLDVTGLGAAWGSDRAVLHDVSLRVDPGEHVAIVGPSGSGKSTLAYVLAGFLPYRGSVLLSGVQVADLDGDDVRRQVTMLGQRDHVFATTIADNVRIGNARATEGDVRSALDRAQLGPWVACLPDGVRTELGSFGTGISGGQGQRIALARLLVDTRALVLLDEPTEHLDAQTADALERDLHEALVQATVLTITHRLVGLERADRIVVLDAGHVVASGTHQQLLAADGWYAREWRRQAQRLDLREMVPSLPIGRARPLSR